MQTYIDHLQAQALPLSEVTPLAPELRKSISDYNNQRSLSEPQAQALAQLEHPQLSFVVSGQQVGLYLSPLLILYKTASAIVLAKQLERESSTPCIPLFWLQSEDHDLEEISTATVLYPSSAASTPDARATLQLEWPALESPAQNRRSVDHLRLPESISALNQRLGELLQSAPHLEELQELLAAHYRPGVGVVDAFAGMLGSVFAEYPLLCFNPRAAAVATMSKELYREVFSRSEEIGHALRVHADALGEAAPIHVREHSPLFFIESKESKERFRIEPEANDPRSWRYIGSDERMSEAELLRVLDEEPERLSSSALLRPLVQNMLLPTRAYIGGPAEIAYSVQVRRLAELLGRPQAPVLERLHCSLIEARAADLRTSLGLSLAELSAGRTQARARLLGAQARPWRDPDSIAALAEEQLAALFSLLRSDVEQLDPTLESPLEKTRGNCSKAIDTFLGKYRKAAENREHVQLERLDRLLFLLSPEEGPQERLDSSVSFIARYGKSLIPRIVMAFESSTTSNLEIVL